MLDLARLRVVAITDRRMMGPDVAGAIARALAGVPIGSVAIQVREKDLDGGALLELAKIAVASGAPVLVNDRVDVALAANAAGVHLPENGMSVADVRAVVRATGDRPFVVGVSRHAADAPADGADLVQLGSIWASPGKGDALGVDVLRRRRATMAANTPIVVAVGGIDSIERTHEAAAAGASAVAMIRAAWTGDSLAPFVDAVERGLPEQRRELRDGTRDRRST
jgi:thiamine-phosphate pyrophosphorylase